MSSRIKFLLALSVHYVLQLMNPNKPVSYLIGEWVDAMRMTASGHLEPQKSEYKRVKLIIFFGAHGTLFVYFILMLVLQPLMDRHSNLVAFNLVALVDMHGLAYLEMISAFVGLALMYALFTTSLHRNSTLQAITMMISGQSDVGLFRKGSDDGDRIRKSLQRNYTIFSWIFVLIPGE